MSYKHPDVEDREHCRNNNHLWILKNDKMVCYNCGKVKVLEK